MIHYVAIDRVLACFLFTLRFTARRMRRCPTPQRPILDAILGSAHDWTYVARSTVRLRGAAVAGLILGHHFAN